MATLERDAERDASGPTMFAYRVLSPVSLSQLAREVTEETEGHDVGINAEGDLEHADADSPGELWVAADDITEGTFEAVAEAHEPDFDWYEPDVELAPTIEGVRAKAALGGLLAPDEIQVALRALLADG